MALRNLHKSWVVRLVLAMLPFILFGLLYDSMRYFPNYKFGSIDIRGIYEAERHWFGIGGLTPNEWWLQHTQPVLDLLSGCFYLMWVPLPIAFGIWLFATGRRELCFRYASAFLFVNILGFIGYYIHPAAPPWDFTVLTLTFVFFLFLFTNICLKL